MIQLHPPDPLAPLDPDEPASVLLGQPEPKESKLASALSTLGQNELIQLFISFDQRIVRSARNELRRRASASDYEKQHLRAARRHRRQQFLHDDAAIILVSLLGLFIVFVFIVWMFA